MGLAGLHRQLRSRVDSELRAPILGQVEGVPGMRLQASAEDGAHPVVARDVGVPAHSVKYEA